MVPAGLDNRRAGGPIARRERVRTTRWHSPNEPFSPAPAVDARTAVDGIPCAYNFTADFLGRNIKAGRADKPVYVDPLGTWTYGPLADRVARFAHVLRSLGVRREERILLALLDTIDWPTAFLGAIKAGVVAVPVNTLMTEDDYRFMLADSRARMLVVSEALYPKFANLINSAPDLEHVIVSGDNAHGHARFEDLIAGAKAEDITAPTTRDDMCFWLYSSGSTGKPKGAVHVHANLGSPPISMPRPSSASPTPTSASRWRSCSSPMGSATRMTFPLAVGATTVLLADRPTPGGVARCCASTGRRSSTGCRPSMRRSSPSPAGSARHRAALRRASRRRGAAGAISAGAGRRATAVDILDGIGSTEMLHIFLSNRPGDVRYGTTGKPVPGYELRIVDDDGAASARGEMGELQVRGPDQRADVLEQSRRSRATLSAASGRAPATNTSQDEDGYYVYCGRSDDMLKVGGIWVSPFEVEGALLAHPGGARSRGRRPAGRRTV